VTFISDNNYFVSVDYYNMVSELYHFISKVFRIYLMIEIYIAFQKRINISQITFAIYTKTIEL